MENVNTIELNGQLYDIEDTTARTTAEQNSKELVKVKETANSAQTTATTAQASASTAQTTANEAKTIATTAQTTANEAKENASTKQPIFNTYRDLFINPHGELYLTTSDVQSITNIILNKTNSKIKSLLSLQNCLNNIFETIGTISVFQSNGTYILDLENYSSKVTIFFDNNELHVVNNSSEEIDIFFIPQGLMQI